MPLPQQMYGDPNITQHSQETSGEKEGFESMYFNSHGKHNSFAADS